MAWWYQMVRVNNLQRAANGPGGQYMPLDIAGEMAKHQTYDDWWRKRCAWERLEEIKVPVLSIGHWGKMGLHLRGNILGYERVKSEKHLVVTGAKDVFEAHDQFDHIWYHEQELLPFYDYHLKGKQNGWNKRPKVRLHVGGRDEWRTDSVWPPREAKYKPFYLNGKKSGSVTSLNDGTLSTKKPTANGGSTDWDYPHPGWKLGTVGFGPQGPDPVRGVVTFTTEPLEKDVEIAEPIVLELKASRPTPIPISSSSCRISNRNRRRIARTDCSQPRRWSQRAGCVLHIAKKIKRTVQKCSRSTPTAIRNR